MNIPFAALEAGARKLCAKAGYAWTETPDVHSHWRDQARAAFLAIVEVWPGMRKPMRVNGLQSECWLELPLPQEASDAKR